MCMKNKNNIHKTRWNAIKKYVTFNYNTRGKFTEHQKREIKRYYDEIVAMKKNPHYEYRPRKKENRVKALEYAVQDPKLRRLKVVFIPVSDTSVRPELHFDKSGLVVKERAGSGKLAKRVFRFEHDAMVSDAESEIKRVVDSIPDNYKQCVPLVDQYSLAGVTLKSSAVRTMVKWLGEYDGGRGKSDYRDWLHGVRAYDFGGLTVTEGGELLAKGAREKRSKAEKRAKAVKSAKDKLVYMRRKREGYFDPVKTEVDDRPLWKKIVDDNKGKQ